MKRSISEKLADRGIAVPGAEPVPIHRPTKGMRPHTDGVAGFIVDDAPPGVLFGRKRGRGQSPYDPLLIQLRDAGTGKFLRFDNLRARPSVSVRARKLGIKVLFGEQGQTLWVTLAAMELSTDGVSDSQPKVNNSDLVLQALHNKRCSSGEIVSWMRSNGAPGIGITQVDGLLSNLARSGKIKLRPTPVGLDQPDKWILL